MIFIPLKSFKIFQKKYIFFKIGYLSKIDSFFIYEFFEIKTIWGNNAIYKLSNIEAFF